MKDTKPKPQTSIGCTKETLEKVIQFRNEYNAQWRRNLANYEITEILVDAGIDWMKKCLTFEKLNS